MRRNVLRDVSFRGVFVVDAAHRILSMHGRGSESPLHWDSQNVLIPRRTSERVDVVAGNTCSFFTNIFDAALGSVDVVGTCFSSLGGEVDEMYRAHMSMPSVADVVYTLRRVDPTEKNPFLRDLEYTYSAGDCVLSVHSNKNEDFLGFYKVCFSASEARQGLLGALMIRIFEIKRAARCVYDYMFRSAPS